MLVVTNDDHKFQKKNAVGGNEDKTIFGFDLGTPLEWQQKTEKKQP